MSRPWMPLYVADYLSDTAHLRAAQSGAYLHLIMHYWTKGGLPDDDNQLAAVARMDRKEWLSSKSILQAFFHDGWKHKRIDGELAKSTEISERRSASAQKRWCKTDANASANLSASAYANDMHRAGVPQPQPQDPIPSGIGLAPSAPKAKRSSPKTKIAEDEQPVDSDLEFARSAGMESRQVREEWEKFRDFHRGKGNVMADWRAAWRTWVRNLEKFSARASPAGRSNGTSGFLKSVLDDIREDERAKESSSETILNLPTIRR